MSCAVIFAAGEIDDYKFVASKINSDDFIICADGGIRHSAILNLQVDLWVGDGDSLCTDISAFERINLPVEKDDTDTLFAAKQAVERGFTNVLIFGGTSGNRLDHLFANVSVLHFLKNSGVQARLVDTHNEIFIISNESITISASDKIQKLSVFAYNGVAGGVTLKNVKYPLSNATLTADFPIGISNEFIRDAGATISVKQGNLLVIISSD